MQIRDLYTNSGNEAPFFMIAYFVMSGVLLRAFSPPFGRCKFWNIFLDWIFYH